MLVLWYNKNRIVLLFGENELLFGKSGLNNVYLLILSNLQLTKPNYSVIRYIKDLFLRRPEYIDIIRCFHFPKSNIESHNNELQFKIVCIYIYYL